MTVYYIDLQGVGTKEQFHERLRGALPLPSYYGNNLDALHDVLEESGRDWELIFYNCRDADKALGGYMGALRAMCAETIASWEGRQGAWRIHGSAARDVRGDDRFMGG